MAAVTTEAAPPTGRALARRLVPAVLALIAVGILVAANAEEVGRALSRVTFTEALALAALHLVALVLRAITWGMCVERAGSPVPPRPLHRSSSLRFLADTVVPTYIGLFVRVGLLKRWMGDRSPTVGQMVTADGVTLLIEAFIILALVVLLTPTLGLPWWISIVGAIALGILLWAVLHARERWSHLPFSGSLQVLEASPGTVKLTALLTVVIGIQPIRFGIALAAVGVSAGAFDALLAFIATNFFGALPIGPGPSSIGGLRSILHDVGIADLTAAGLLLAATAVLAAGTYALATLADAVLRKAKL